MAWRRSDKSEEKEPSSPRPPARQTPGGMVESRIADGFVLEGDCKTDGALHVDGHVTGNIEAGQLVIGPTGRVDGNVSGRGGREAEQTLVVHGRVGGSVRAGQVEVGPKGAVTGGLKVRGAVVQGRVVGGIEAEERLLLEETAVVEGDVNAPRLGLKEGGQVFGAIRIGKPPAAENTARAPGSTARADAAAGSATAD